MADLETVEIDVTVPESILHARDEVLANHPDLDLIVTMSGVMLGEDLRDPAHMSQTETTIAVNVLGTIRVIDAFTAHLLDRGAGDIITVTSGIAFLPFPIMPTYGASKAARPRLHRIATGTAGRHRHLGHRTRTARRRDLRAGEGQPRGPAAGRLPRRGHRPHHLEPHPERGPRQGRQMHRWAERDGTYDELVERRSQSLSMLPGR